MKLFITKIKASDNSVFNYFGKKTLVVIDYLVLTDNHLFDNFFESYTDEIQKRDNAFAFTTSDIKMNLSLISGVTSNLGKTVKEFFDAETDNYIPLRFKAAFGESETNIERGGFINSESVTVNERLDDSGFILTFTMYGGEEEYIQQAEQVEALPLPQIENYFRFWLGILTNTQYFSRITLFNQTYLTFQQRLGYDPIVSWFLYNIWLSKMGSPDVWFTALSMFVDHGMAYEVNHSTTCNPAALDGFQIIISFPSASTVVAAPEILDEVNGSKEDHIIGNSIEYANNRLAVLYVSYTAASNADVDIFGCLFMNSSVQTVSYSNIDKNGFSSQYNVNSLRRLYEQDRWIRNGERIPPTDIKIIGSQRAFVATFDSVNVGIALGRCLVRSFNYIPANPPFVVETYTDTGFNNIVNATAKVEYKYLISGACKWLDVAIKYPLNSVHRINKQFPYLNKNWIIKRITSRDSFNSAARIYCTQKK